MLFDRKLYMMEFTEKNMTEDFAELYSFILNSSEILF